MRGGVTYLLRQRNNLTKETQESFPAQSFMAVEAGGWLSSEEFTPPGGTGWWWVLWHPSGHRATKHRWWRLSKTLYNTQPQPQDALILYHSPSIYTWYSSPLAYNLGKVFSKKKKPYSLEDRENSFSLFTLYIRKIFLVLINFTAKNSKC